VDVRFSTVFAVAIAVAATGAALGGCHRSDSVLIVEVAGDVTLQPAQLRVTVTAGGSAQMLSVPPKPTSISLPTSFTVELAPSVVGPVLVSVTALDGSGSTIASGAATRQYLDVGGETILAIALSAGSDAVDGGSGDGGGEGGSDAADASPPLDGGRP
jgi:hypothetical protein